MAITPDGKVLLVGAIGGRAVTPINTAANKAGQPIPVRLGPIDIAITPDGKTAYVVNFGNGRAEGHTVTPIRIATLRAGRPIKVGTNPDNLVIAP
jgi:hyaluronoglucosaminidase